MTRFFVTMRNAIDLCEYAMKNMVGGEIFISNMGKLNIIPSFTPGLYGEGNGKDLGHILEFKSEVQLSIDIFSNSELGFSYNHISNASLGDKNPGANSYMFNFLKRF